MFPIYIILLLWTIETSASVNGPILPLYAQSLGINIIDWSILATSSALGMFLFEWFWGRISDRVDRRLLMLLSALGMSAIFPVYTLKSAIPYFIIVQFFWGAIGVGLGPTTRAYVTDESPQKSVGLFSSLWWSFATLGRIIGPIIGAYIAVLYGFSYSFYASSVLGLVLACLVVLTLPKPKTRTTIQATPRFKSTFHMRSAGFLFLSTVFGFMPLSLMKSFLPLYASEQVNMSTVQVGILLSAAFAAQLLAIPLFGWLSDKFGRRRMAAVGLLLSSALFLLYLVIGTQDQLFLVSVFASAGLAAFSLLLAIVPEVTRDEFRGAAIGMYGSFEDLGFIIGPLVLGFAWNTFSPVSIFVVASCAQLVSAIFVLKIKPEQSRD
jgi:DHA1 family multidrug resistance protein-like MFS transporter